MFHVTTLNHFLLVALSVTMHFLLQSNHITELCILNFIPTAKDLLTALNCFLYTISSFVLGRSTA